MYEVFIEPFELPFMASALIELLILSVLSGVVGVFVLLRRLTFVADTLTHTVFPGVVIGYLLAGDSGIFIGALIAGAITAIALTLFTARHKVHEDAALAVLLTGMFAIGVVLVSRQTSYTSDLTAFLFGRVLTVSGSQITQSVIVTVIVLTVLALLGKELLLRSFDPLGSRALGYPVIALDLILNVLVALTVVAAVQAIGTLLVLALLVVPAATGKLVSDRFSIIALVGCALAALASYLGLVASFDASVNHDLRLATAPTVVVILAICYALALGVRPLRGLFTRNRRPSIPTPQTEPVELLPQPADLDQHTTEGIRL